MIDRAHPLLLGSASPRRREILETLGLPVVVAPAHVDETMLAGESADAYLDRVTLAKLEATGAAAGAVIFGAVLVADTSVVVDGEVLGKPADDGDARRMIERLAGRSHEVWTRFAIARPEAPQRAAHAETVRTRVTFRALDAAMIDAYVATGEGRDKAGAYAIQGVGSFVVKAIAGSYSNVVGLPACEVVEALLGCSLLRGFPLPRPAAP